MSKKPESKKEKRERLVKSFFEEATPIFENNSAHVHWCVQQAKEEADAVVSSHSKANRAFHVHAALTLYYTDLVKQFTVCLEHYAKKAGRNKHESRRPKKEEEPVAPPPPPPPPAPKRKEPEPSSQEPPKKKIKLTLKGLPPTPKEVIEVEEEEAAPKKTSTLPPPPSSPAPKTATPEKAPTPISPTIAQIQQGLQEVREMKKKLKRQMSRLAKTPGYNLVNEESPKIDSPLKPVTVPATPVKEKESASESGFWEEDLSSSSSEEEMESD